MTSCHILGLYSYKRQCEPCAFLGGAYMPMITIQYLKRDSAYDGCIRTGNTQRTFRYFCSSCLVLGEVTIPMPFLNKESTPNKGLSLYWSLHRASILKLSNPSPFHIKNLHVAERFWVLGIPAEHFLKLLHPSVCIHETTPEQLNKFIGACHFYLKSVSVNG
jgi:hypothetical protein